MRFLIELVISRQALHFILRDISLVLPPWTDLKQLAWIQKALSQDTPIKGWKDSLVQRCLDSLATDSTTAKLITRYDLTVADFEEPIQEILQVIVPSLRDHALWILGEPGKGKTPLGRVVAMMFSRYHGGHGTYPSGSGGRRLNSIKINSASSLIIPMTPRRSRASTLDQTRPLAMMC